MSFALGFAPDARSQWQNLDFELQEIVLDELDKLAGDESRITGGVFQHKFRHVQAGVPHYFILRVIVDVSARTITLVGIYDHTAELN